MDKFGIFKLLSSFMDFYSKNKNTNSNTENSNSSPSLNLSNVLSSLFGKDNSQSQPLENSQVPQKQKTSTQEVTAKPPLQNKMLAVMTSHDNFVKRVKK
ncbi:MAG: hypothetical protein E7362_00615 [Clostridiales bacterium]|nr:hypothetical protein [Clostridiales bacterium]